MRLNAPRRAPTVCSSSGSTVARIAAYGISTGWDAIREYGINTLFIENYWNAGSPRAQSRYIDNVVVSTEPIGCGRIR